MINNKRKIVDAVFVLSLKNGFDRVSIKQIQEESGLAIGSIYYHFKNKDEILEYMVEKYLLDSFNELKREVEKLDLSFMKKIDFIFNYKINYFATKEIESEYIITRPKFNHKDYFVLLTSIYHHHPEVRHFFYELHDLLFDFYYKLIKEAIDKGEIRDDIDIKTLVIFIQTILKGYIDLWVYQPNFSFEELVESNIKMIEESIKKQ
ncbi:hypothetical protein SDC9_07669 [bioreactor metagenome]|uniref:HTH tetR-type domain-containing protein n=1 Tax=bioreactor metagenome TaxID=1076179 RepID=A0A644T5F4_9ZZZZ|nr:TetR/AcrR family transcriptional regulator [Methanobrevibacter sp.]MEA4956534.1 TetR/AcrR family transcriptional regulator [Methanobrevibacter sp.]